MMTEWASDSAVRTITSGQLHQPSNSNIQRTQRTDQFSIETNTVFLSCILNTLSVFAPSLLRRSVISFLFLLDPEDEKMVCIIICCIAVIHYYSLLCIWLNNTLLLRDGDGRVLVQFQFIVWQRQRRWWCVVVMIPFVLFILNLYSVLTIPLNLSFDSKDLERAALNEFEWREIFVREIVSSRLYGSVHS